MRTIQAPSIDIKEIEKSNTIIDNTNTTNVLAFGYTSAGEDMRLFKFNNFQDWISYYGNPETEEENYLYNTAKTTLDAGGNLICAKLPYENVYSNIRPWFEYSIHKYEYTEPEDPEPEPDPDIPPEPDPDIPPEPDIIIQNLLYRERYCELVESLPLDCICVSKEERLYDEPLSSYTKQYHLKIQGTFRRTYNATDNTYFTSHKTFKEQHTTRADGNMYPPYDDKFTTDKLPIEYNTTQFSGMISFTDDDGKTYTYTNDEVQFKFEECFDGNYFNHAILIFICNKSDNSLPEIKISLSRDDFNESFDYTDANDYKHLFVGAHTTWCINNNRYPEYTDEDIAIPNIRAFQTNCFTISINGKNKYLTFIQINNRNKVDKYAIQYLWFNNEYKLHVFNYNETKDEFIKIKDNIDIKTELKYGELIIENKSKRNTTREIIDVEYHPYFENKELDTYFKNDNLYLLTNQSPDTILEESCMLSSTNSLSTLNQLLDGDITVPENTIRIFDRCAFPYKEARPILTQYNEYNSDNCEMLGIVPVIITAPTAFAYQNNLELPTEISRLAGIKFDTIQGKIIIEDIATIQNNDTVLELLNEEACKYFPTIPFDTPYQIDNKSKTNIAIVVFKLYNDESIGNRLCFEVVESFYGSIFNNESIETDNCISDIINKNSKYIYCFSNFKPLPEIKCVTLPTTGYSTMSLGIPHNVNKKETSNKCLLNSLNQLLDNVSDINETEIDILVDGGISTISQALAESNNNENDNPQNITNAILSYRRHGDKLDTHYWKNIAMIYDNFCRVVRRDCMFILDAPRALCITGNNKLVRRDKKGSSIDLDILPYIKYLTGINTSYGAGYCNWFQVINPHTDMPIWIPPTSHAIYAYINCDKNYFFWFAPAGLQHAYMEVDDISFNPNVIQAGNIYSKSWNYANKFINDDICIEGQKTLTSRTSAFDRINVRRLFLKLERVISQNLKQYLYSPNTNKTRESIKNMIIPIMERIKINKGVYDYRLVIPSVEEDTLSVDNNEIRIKLLIKPTKILEFITVTFVVLSTRAIFEEY